MLGPGHRVNQFDLVHIHPSGARKTPRFLFFPAGLIPLINEVRSAGYSVASINEPMEMLRNSSRSIADLLADYDSPCYAIDIHWHEHIHGGMSIARLIKRMRPSSRVVVGGLTASFFGADLLRACSAIDYVVAGYGEGQLPRLAQGFRGKRQSRLPRGIIQSHTPPADMDQYDYVTCDWLLHWRDYARCALDGWMEGASGFWLKNGMGCSLNCAFCGGSQTAQKRIFGNSRVVQRSARQVAADIITLSRQGIQRIALTQDPCLAPPAYWRELHREIRTYDERPAIYIEAVGTPSAAFIEDFAATYDLRNSIISLWPVCASEAVRARFGKPLSDRQVFDCLRAMRRHNVRPVLYLTRKLEPDGPRSHMTHARFIKDAADAYGALDVFESYVIVDPGSPAANCPGEYGLKVTLRTCGDYISRTRLRSDGREYDQLGYRLVQR
jgi:radical SAM superfamily enzyme YgiQ (UPF0313 family)